MLVLTGTCMNYENKATLYDEAKRSLKKFKGDVCESNGNMSSNIKFEPAFFTQKEEALWAAGYVRGRDYQNNYAGKTSERACRKLE